MVKFTVDGEKFHVPKDCIASRWSGERIGTDKDGDPIYEGNLFHFFLPDYHCVTEYTEESLNDFGYKRNRIIVLETRYGLGKNAEDVFNASLKRYHNPPGYRVIARRVDKGGRTTLLFLSNGLLRRGRRTIEKIDKRALLACTYPDGLLPSCEIVRALSNMILTASFSAFHRARARQIDEAVTKKVIGFTGSPQNSRQVLQTCAHSTHCGH